MPISCVENLYSYSKAVQSIFFILSENTQNNDKPSKKICLSQD